MPAAGPSSRSLRTPSVRTATAEDLPALLALSAELETTAIRLWRGREPGRRGGAPATGAARYAGRYEALLADPDARVLLGCFGCQPAGMALLTVGPASSLVDTPAVHVSHLVVSRDVRKRGLGRALLAASVTFAEERGLEHVAIAAQPGDREANRYFARLGFAPVAVRRLAPTALLRRQLGQPPTGERPAGAGAPVRPVPARQRRLRDRAAAYRRGAPGG